jgi:cell wall-associated NlpC family hydrolase
VLRLVCAAAVAAGTVLVPLPAGAAPQPGGDGRTVAQQLTGLQKLYRQAEQATETYNATAQQLERQRAEVARLDRALGNTRRSLRDSRTAAGRLARQQYQSSTDLSPYLRLLLARDPQQALDQGHVIGRLARERAATVGRLTGTEHRAAALAARARAALARQTSLAERQRKDRDEVRGRLKKVEELLASLTPQQLSALAALEKNGVAKAQHTLLASGALGDGDRPASDRGERAVRYAVRQLGKPYQWGAEGPKSYDCSGLTSQAWLHAGTPIPRTSQEQWARLPKVPLRRLRPGDLVIYFPEATHVALYLGRGLVVQAPRTGEKIKVSPLASFPILGAVRPDGANRAPATETRQTPVTGQAPATETRQTPVSGQAPATAARQTPVPDQAPATEAR